MPLEKTSKEWTGRVASTAHRLRTIMKNFADDPAAKRNEYLQEVVEVSLDEVLPDQRLQFLEDLAPFFPVFGPAGGGDPADQGAESRQRSGTPDLLFREVADWVPYLDEKDQRELIEKLSVAGLPITAAEKDGGTGASGGPSGNEIKQIERILRAFHIESLDYTRGVKAMVLLLEFVEQVALCLPSEVGDPELGSTFRRYIAGDTRISGVEIKSRVDTLQQKSLSWVSGET